MKKIKSFKLFLENTNSRIGKVNFSNRRNTGIFKHIELYKIARNIYAVKIEDPNLRTLLFMRYAEFYESPNNEFRDTKVNVDEYIKWYKKDKKADLFTYQYDWSGFNIPSYSIKKCIDQIQDTNDYDIIMKNIIAKIDELNKGQQFYLLGVDQVEGDLLEHELAHGLYYTNKTYKKEMDTLTQSLPTKVFEALKAILLDYGYTDFVVNDEIQAYISTGLGESMDEIRGIKKWIKIYREVLNKHLKLNVKPVKLNLSFDEVS